MNAMNNHNHLQDMYYDQSSSRSPGAHRHQQQTLHRQPSRQFDAYGQMPPAMYVPEEPSSRYETNRFDRMNNTMQGGGYAYDPTGGAQTWNPTAFGGGNNFPQYGGATGRMKSQTRGRTALPTVFTCPLQQILIYADTICRPGSISNNHLSLR